MFGGFAAQAGDVVADALYGGGQVFVLYAPEGGDAAQGKEGEQDAEGGGGEEDGEGGGVAEQAVEAEHEGEDGGKEEDGGQQQGGGDFEGACGLVGEVEGEQAQAQEQQVGAFVEQGFGVADFVFDAHGRIPFWVCLKERPSEKGFSDGL